jgi:hypothetical protein
VIHDLQLAAPVARSTDAWLTLGLDEDVEKAAALASVVDLRITQLVNGVCGVHAVLRDDAIR